MTLTTDFRQPLRSLRRSARSFARPQRPSPLDGVTDVIERVATSSPEMGLRLREWFVPSHKRSVSGPRAAAASLGTVAALVAYRQLVRPWQRAWGASEAELDRSLPGDDLVPEPTYTTTRAITVKAPPSVIWPVLLEFGHWRGHLYTDDDLATALGTSGDGAKTDEARFQHLDRDDAVGFGPAPWVGRWHRMRVVEMIPRRALIFGAMDEVASTHEATDRQLGTWAFILAPITSSMTRLIVRTRSRPSWALRPAIEAYDPVAFLAERHLLLTIQRAAEKAQQSSSTRSRVPA